VNSLQSRAPINGLQYGDVLLELLGSFVDMRDRQVEKGVSGSVRPIVLNPDNPRGSAARSVVALLRNPEVSESEFWGELCWFGQKFDCFKVAKSKKRGISDPDWVNAKLYFNDSMEAIVREWLERPASDPRDNKWQAALKFHLDSFEAEEEVWAWRRPDLPAGYKSYDHFLSCWGAMGATLRQTSGVSWRHLSAQCFLGDSKFLDTEAQQALARKLYPTLTGKIVSRPLLLHLYLPRSIERVLIIENQDSFTEMAGLRPKTTALVYGMGYRAGSMRVRQVGVPHFSLYGCSAESGVLSQFERWWVEQESHNWEVHFWGDLDFAGLDIAASLKRSFPTLDCWPEGYEPMLKHLEMGGGHTPEQAGKGRQRRLAETGCIYADTRLLPAIVKSGKFVDQEVVSVGGLPGVAYL